MTEKTTQALVRVGQAVCLAVERFVSVGQTIATENPEISADMCQACAEARNAGQSSYPLLGHKAADKYVLNC